MSSINVMSDTTGQAIASVLGNTNTKLDVQNILLAAIAGGQGGLPVNDWQTLQAIVRAGYANKIFTIGDRLMCEKTTGGSTETLCWDIIGIDHDTPTDANLTHSMTLQLHSCVQHVFDASSNVYAASSVRAYINSAASGDFLEGIDADFLAVCANVNKTVTDSGGSISSSEKFFLPSREEIYAASGSAYEYYGKFSSSSEAGVGADQNRVKYSNNNAVAWWTRDYFATVGDSKAWAVADAGTVVSKTVYTVASFVAPCVCIA